MRRRRKKRNKIIILTAIFIGLLLLFNQIIYATFVMFYDKYIVTDEQRFQEQDARFRRAEKHFQDGNFKAALKEYKSYNMLYPQGELISTIIYKTAESYKFLGNYEEAISTYYSFVEKFPNNKLASSALIEIVEIRRKSLQRVLDQQTAQFKEAEEAYSKQNYKLAITKYKEFIDQHPGHSLSKTCLYKIAESYKFLNKPYQALTAYYIFIGIYPNEHTMVKSAMLNIAEIYRFEEMVLPAKEAYKAYIKKYPDDEDVVSAQYWVEMLDDREIYE